MSYENQPLEAHPQPELTVGERLAEQNISERSIRKRWGLDYTDFKHKIIGEGAQTWVLDAGPDEVVKLNKPIDAVIEHVQGWGHEDLDVDTVVGDLVNERNMLIKWSYYQKKPADLLGHIALQPVRNDTRPFEAALLIDSIFEGQEDHAAISLGPTVTIRQPRCKELVSDFLEHADELEAAELFTNFTNFVRRHWWYGFGETTYKFGEQYGIMDDDKQIWGNPLLLLDAGEHTMDATEVYTHVIGKRWRNVFNGIDARPLPRHLERYYDHMDQALAEDVFHTIWGQHHSLRFNAPWRTPDASPRPAGILRDAFEHTAWQDFCLDALDDIEHPKAMVVEFEKPVAPINDALNPDSKLKNRWLYPGMIAYYRQLPPNSLLDNPNKPVWMWELQFLTDEPLQGILSGEPDRARDSWGVTLMLRENDYSLRDTYFTGNTDDRLQRRIHLNRLPYNGFALSAPCENARRPKLDEHMLAMFQQTAIKNHKIIDGYPFDGHL